jgi:predicted membrane GTPase involved in stress response
MYKIELKGVGYVEVVTNDSVTLTKVGMRLTSRQQADKLSESLSEKFNLSLQVVECED